VLVLRYAPGSLAFEAKLRSAPKLFRVAGRPNSPPPELLNRYATRARMFCELHFGAMRWHETAKVFDVDLD